MKTLSPLWVGTFSYAGDVKCSTLKSLFVDITHSPSLVILTSSGGVHSTLASQQWAQRRRLRRMFPLKLRRSSLLARGDSAYRCVAGSLFSPRRAGLLTLPLSSFWICQVSICLLLPSRHTWFELLRKIYPSTLRGWIALDWHSGTNFRSAKKKSSACLHCTEREGNDFKRLTELSLRKIIPYVMFFISISLNDCKHLGFVAFSVQYPCHHCLAIVHLENYLVCPITFLQNISKVCSRIRLSALCSWILWSQSCSVLWAHCTELFPINTFTPCQKIVFCSSRLFCINQNAINKRKLKLDFHFECLFRRVCTSSKHTLHTARSVLPTWPLCDVLYQRISKEGAREKMLERTERYVVRERGVHLFFSRSIEYSVSVTWKDDI